MKSECSEYHNSLYSNNPNRMSADQIEDWKNYGFTSKEEYENAIWKILPTIGDCLREQDRFKTNYSSRSQLLTQNHMNRFDRDYLSDRKDRLQESYRYYSDMYDLSTSRREKEYFEDMMNQVYDRIQDISEVSDQDSDGEYEYSESDEIEILDLNKH